MAKAIHLKRVYDPPAREDGARFLVERLWPRGIRKTELAGTEWMKDVAPSAELRTWFHHDPERWAEFRKRYFAELSGRQEALEPLMKAARRGTVTLVYSSHDSEHNNAVALKEFMERRLR